MDWSSRTVALKYLCSVFSASGVTSHRQPRQWGTGAQKGKGPKVTRIMYQDCQPVENVCRGPKNYSYATVLSSDLVQITCCKRTLKVRAYRSRCLRCVSAQNATQYNTVKASVTARGQLEGRISGAGMSLYGTRWRGGSKRRHGRNNQSINQSIY